MPCGKVGSGAWRRRIGLDLGARRAQPVEHGVEGRARGAVAAVGDDAEAAAGEPPREARDAVGEGAAGGDCGWWPGVGARGAPALRPLARMRASSAPGSIGREPGPTSFIPFHSIGLCEAVTMSPPSAPRWPVAK
jgi:hypothetical protein